jgi:hypothetical protein
MRGNTNQVENVLAMLSKNSGSKRAVIQLFNAEDTEKRYPEIARFTALEKIGGERTKTEPFSRPQVHSFSEKSRRTAA